MLKTFVLAWLLHFTNQESISTTKPSRASEFEETHESTEEPADTSSVTISTSQAYETNSKAWSESLQDASASGLQRVGLQRITDVLTEETDSPEDQGKATVPYKALWPCLALCASVYLFYARRITTSIKQGYRPLADADGDGGNLSGLLVAAAVLYWLMPLVMLAMGFLSTPEGGAPLMAYGLWLGFFVCHLAAAFKFGHLTAERALSCCEPLGKAEKLFYAVLEHLDMATDAMFVGMAGALGDSLTDLWVQAWQDVPFGQLLVPVIQSIGFNGVALVIFTTTAYLPQLLASPSFFVPFLCLAFLGITWVWVSFGLFPGLVVSAGAFAVGESGVADWWWKEAVMPYALRDDAKLLRWLKLEAFAAPEGTQKESHLYTVVATTVIFENGPQLWLQSAFMALSWGHLGPQARAQTSISVLVSLALSSQKLVALMKSFRLEKCCDLIECLFWLVLFGAVAFLLWVTAKVAFVFICPSHLWNLSTGCVDVA